MASQILSGAKNASYTNNTGQNIRLIINYMSNVTSMTWAGVTVTASSTTIGKDIQNITGELRQAVTGVEVYNDLPTPTFIWKAKIASYEAFLIDDGDEYMPNPINNESSLNPLLEGLARTGNFYSRPVDDRIRGPRTEHPNLFYVPLTISRGGNFPTELMLATGESFSSVCGAYNAVVIKEDGT